jgi:hypothetical protein
MAADQGDERIKGPSAGSGSSQGDSGPDLLRGSQIIKDLNLARTNSGLYPPDHPLIAGSLDRVYAALLELGGGSPLTIVDTEDALIVGGATLDARNSAFRDFAAALSVRSIFSITFMPGFTRDDLLLLHRILNQPAAELWKSGGAHEATGRLGLERIVLREVDYSRFRLTDEEEVPSGAPAEEKDRRDRVWRDFVNQVLGEDPDQARGDRLRAAAKGADPGGLARFINDDPASAGAALRGFGGLLRANDGRVPSPVVLGKMGELLRGLKPELKHQLLAMTFDHWRDRDDVAWEGLGGDLVGEMLEQASQDHKRISPALLNLVNTLSFFEMGPSAGGAAEGDSEAKLDKFKAFFVEGDRTSYTDIEYGAVLDRLSRGQEGIGPASSEPDSGASGPGPSYPWRESLAADLKAALDPAEAALRLTGLLTLLVEQDLDPKDYASFARRLVEGAPVLLAAGEFGRLLEILNAFRRHSAGEDAEISRTSQGALRIFLNPEFVSRAVRAFLAGSGTTKEAVLLFGALGRPALDEIAGLYVRTEFQAGSGRLARLLGDLGPPAVEEILKHLDDKDAGVVRQALSFLKSYGNNAILPKIRPLLRHEDDQVRTDALSLLLSQDDLGAGDALQRALRSSVDREALAAIRLAGQHRRSEAAPELRRMIRAGVFHKSDARRDFEIVRALGRIGDPRVLSTLAKFTRGWSLLDPGGWRNLRLAIYESLEGYPQDSVAGLVRAGLRSKDSRIRAVCRSLQRGGSEPPASSSKESSKPGQP